MKNTALTLLLFLVALTLQAQKTQRSLVREQNSGKKPVPGAQVVFSEANPVISDNDGLFTLNFPRKKAGEWVFLEDVQKSGYELVNKKDIEQVKLSADERLGVDIIVAPAGKLDAARREYYDISDKALLAGFEREKKALRDKLQKAQLNQQEYEEKYESIQKQYDQQQQQLNQLADKFARVNFDDVSPVYQEALELYKAGHIDQAIAKLESINPAKRTEEIIKEEKRIGEAQKELDTQRAALETEKRQQIANLKLLADMYSADFDPEKAEAQYDQLLRLDSTDFEILWDAAWFYKENHRYDKALAWYPVIIKHPKTAVWQVANAYGSLGELHTATGNFPTALEDYTRSFSIYEKLHRGNPEESFHKENLAISFERLGSTHTALGNKDQALTFFENFNKLEKELYMAYPQSVDFKTRLAISYEKLGSIHTALGHLDQALTFFENFNTLEKELYAAYPQNVDFKNGLAISYWILGRFYREKKKRPG
ncbi:MAG: tetratricopeptide repeat protein [Saprospiraceae bacterium]|nr:tetratricopeptide repeat protein [Saprospiraceae bacterium]